MELIDLFKRLLQEPSPPGYENRVCRIVSNELDAIGCEYAIDGAGNLTVDLPNASQSTEGRTIFAAHMDEIAMVITSISENGALTMVRSGGLHPAKLGEGPVTILGDTEDVTGILSFGSMHVKQTAEPGFGWEQARVLTGFSREELAAKGVNVGSPAVAARERCGPVELGPASDPLIVAWTFDDRMGVAILIKLVEYVIENSVQTPWPCTVAFTVHEEGGCHGAKLVARRLAPKRFIAVDGSPIPPGSDLAIDGRPGIWRKDAHTQYSAPLVAELCASARSVNIELQHAVFEQAGSDASAVYAAGFAEQVAVIGHVRENSHGYEVARLSVFSTVLQVLEAFVTR